MKWAMVMVGILVLSMCGSTKSAAPPTGDDPASTTVAEESTTTTASTTTTEPTTKTEPPTTTLLEEPPDLSGIWDATLYTTVAWGDKHCTANAVQEGTVLISQAGMTFDMEFSDGFKCRPASACEFEGTLDWMDSETGFCWTWTANNGGAPDEEGTYFSHISFSADVEPVEIDGGVESVPLVDYPSNFPPLLFGSGMSQYESEDFECGWATQLFLTIRTPASEIAP